MSTTRRMLGGRTATATVLAVAFAGALLTVARLRPDARASDFAPAGSAAAAALERISDAFPVTDELLVVVSDDDAPDDATARTRLLAFATRLETAIRADPVLDEACRDVAWSPDVEGAKRFFAEVLVDGALASLPDEAFAEATRRLTPEGMQHALNRLEADVTSPGAVSGRDTRALLRDPLRLRELVDTGVLLGVDAGAADGFFSDDGRRLLVRIAGRRSPGDLAFVTTFVAAVEAAVIRADPRGLGIDYSGGYAIARRSHEAIRGDIIRSTVGSLLLIQILFLLTYRRWWAFPIAFMPAAVGMAVGFGALAAFSTRLTPITAVSAAILVGLGVDYAVHLLSRYGHLRRRLDPPAAAALARDGVLRPVLLAASTSIVAFLALSAAGVPAIREFSRFAAVGLVAAVAATLVVVPACLARVDRGRRAATGPQRAAAIERLQAAVTRRSGVAVAGSVSLWIVFAVLAVTLAPRVLRVERDLSSLHPQPNRPLEVQREIAERFGLASEMLLVHVTADDGATLVARAGDVAAGLDTPAGTAAGIAGTFGPHTLLPDPRDADARRAKLETLDPAAIAAAFDDAVAQSVFAPSAFGDYVSFLRRLCTPAPTPDLETLRGGPREAAALLPGASGARDHGAEAVVIVRFAAPFRSRAERDGAVALVGGVVAGVPGAVLTGVSVIAAETETIVHEQLVALLVIAALLVIVLLVVVLRRPADVLLALVPSAFALTGLLAWMGITGTTLNPLNLAGFPLLVGLGVDDGIFLVSTLRRPRTTETAVAGGCHAIAVTSVTSMLAFGSLSLTSTPAMRSLGLMTAIGIGLALFASLLLVAPLVVRVSSRRCSKVA